MANEEHLEILNQGVEAWNSWRAENLKIAPDLGWANLKGANLEGAYLTGADLRGTNLAEADLFGAILEGVDLREANLQRSDLSRANLSRANLRRANLRRANLSWASLEGASLREAHLTEADLTEADLFGANLSGAHLTFANLGWTYLIEANLEAAVLGKTIFVDVDLSSAKGLDSCKHRGGSAVDHTTLSRTKNVPISFWRGCGLPDALIDYMPSLTGDAIQFYSCFISYSSKDQDFADRLHADLQNAGVRCWFAPHDLEIGAVIEDDIDAQIRVRDKVILILSEASVSSAWVTREVRTALDEEQKSDRRVLFPLRLDGAVMDTTEQWAHDLQRKRNIGDFTRWKEHDAYQETFERVLRDLTTST